MVFASERDYDAVTDIWKLCFGDSEEYIQMYLEKRFTTENMLVIHEDGRPVSMASFLPVHVTMNGELVEARYVYAVGTLPEYRQKGYATEIIRYAFEKYQMPLILQPAEDELEAYYTRLGFVKAFEASPCWCFESFSEYEKEKMTIVSEISEREWDFQKITAREYKALRDEKLAGEGYVEWDEQAVSYAIEENAFCDGETWKLILEDSAELLMYRKEDKRLRIVETTLEKDRLIEILPVIMQKTSCSKVYADNAGGMIWLPEAVTWEEKKGYLSFTLG